MAPFTVKSSFHTIILKIGSEYLNDNCGVIHTNNTKHFLYTELFIIPSGISKIDCATTKTDTADVNPVIKFLRHATWARTATSFRSAQAATLLEFNVPFTNCFVCRWFCVVYDPKAPLHRHN